MNYGVTFLLAGVYFLIIMLRGTPARATMGTRTLPLCATGALAWRGQGAAVEGFSFSPPTHTHFLCRFVSWMVCPCAARLVGPRLPQRTRKLAGAETLAGLQECQGGGISAAHVMGYVGPPRTRGPRARGSAAGRFRAGLSRRVTHSRLMRRATRASSHSME